jgi:hypothetical protein
MKEIIDVITKKPANPVEHFDRAFYITMGVMIVINILTISSIAYATVSL